MLTLPKIAEELVLEFWSGECGFKLRPLPCGVPEEYRIFSHNPYGAEGGGVEYGRILLAKPRSNVLRYAFESRGLDFFHQPALNNPRCLQPEHIIDSYAVYHKTKKNNEYTTGKACHIYRAWAEDSKGVRIWCDLRIGRHEARVTLPEWFWESAHYPIYVDPTIGKTDLGGQVDVTGKFALANPFVCGGSGDANPGTAYIGAKSSTSATVYAAAYDNGDGNVSSNNRLAVSTGIVVNSAVMQFFSNAITWTSIVNGTTYFLEVYSNTTDFSTAVDTSTGSNQYTSTGATASPPDPHAARSGTQTLTPSIYVDYTASGGASAGLRRNSSLNGLGTSGPFFHDPLAFWGIA